MFKLVTLTRSYIRKQTELFFLDTMNIYEVESDEYVVVCKPRQEQIFSLQLMTDVKLIHVHVTRHSKLNHTSRILTIKN